MAVNKKDRYKWPKIAVANKYLTRLTGCPAEKRRILT